jgi:MFS family permease
VLGKKYLQDFAGLSSAAAAAFMLAMTAASALTAASGGILPRLFGNRQKPAMLLGATLFVVSMAMLLGGTLHRSPEWVYLAGYILLAVALIGGPSAFSTMKDLGGTDSMAAGISILNALSYVGCGFVGQIGGMILDRYPVDGPVSTSTITYPQGAYVGLFYFLSALALLNFVLTLAVPETGAVRARNRQDERPRHRSSRYES